MNFNDLLREAGLGAYSGLFGTGKQVASAVGFTGDAVKDFAQFFLQEKYRIMQLNLELVLELRQNR